MYRYKKLHIKIINMLVSTSMKMDIDEKLHEKIKRHSISAYVVFFVVFSVLATMLNISYLKKDFVFSAGKEISSLAKAKSKASSSVPHNKESDVPMQPILEEELEHQTVSDDGDGFVVNEFIYLSLVHDHFYLQSFVHAGYGQSLYRPPAVS